MAAVAIFGVVFFLEVVPMIAKHNRVITVHFVRHGQATHNVRAELKREQGCSHSEFIAQMKEDDELDADLTPTGREQARAASSEGARRRSIELVVCSPLSRAIETASLVFAEQGSRGVPFVSVENLREWNGYLENSRRRPRTDLAARFPSVDFSGIPEVDTSWSHELEAEADVAERGVRFLTWLALRPESEMAVVAHGGIFSSLFKDARVCDEGAHLQPRFGNCEMRTVQMTVLDSGVFQFGQP